MKKRWFKVLVATLVTSSLFVTTVFAAPDANAIKKQKEEAQKQVNSLQEELTKLMVKIDELEEDLIETGEDIEAAEADLVVAEEKEKQQYADMKLRIKYMYEEGDNTAIEKIISSGSLSEFLNAAEYVQSVHSYDRQMLDEYVETKNEIIDLKTELEEKQEKLQTQEKEFKDQKATLNSTLESKKEEVKNLEAAFQAALEEARREAEERARREAEERAKREEERRKQQEAQQAATNNHNSSSNNNRPASNSGTTNNSNSSSNTKPQKTEQTVETPKGDSSKASIIVSAAYGQLGTPYVWGGTTPGKGLDCSGLVQYCHRQAGISLPRTSGSQGSGGKAVSSPQAGDVVCYSGHVGVYIGGGKMIHAPEPGDVVKVAKVYGSPWYRRYW